jgi:hypothetical protein
MAAERHGSRWYNEQPTEEQVRDWFFTQPLHEGMPHEPYLGGIVLISAKEKSQVQKENANGGTYFQEIERIVFVPYVKVDTRIAYFWNYVRHLNGGSLSGDYIGVIEPVEVPRMNDHTNSYFNGHLPDGYSMLPVRNENDSISRFLVATQRVAIYERESYAQKVAGKPSPPVLQGRGSKQTALAKRWADDNALMKAETGAIGRALGVAGILVVGTGVATAEDMQEAQAGPTGAAAAAGEGATLPEDPIPAEGEGVPAEAASPLATEQATPMSPQEADEQFRTQATKLQREFSESYPDAYAAYVEWWKTRFPDMGLNQLTGPALKGAVVKLERDLDAAKQATATAEPAPEQ